MKQIKRKLGWLLCGLALFCVGPAASKSYPVTVIRVVDGDTVKLRINVWMDMHVETSVRLDGIDAPEKKSKFKCERVLAKQAEDFANAWTQAHKNVPMEFLLTGREKYGRPLGILSADGVGLNEELLRAGRVKSYTGGKRQPWCEDVK